MLCACYGVCNYRKPHHTAAMGGEQWEYRPARGRSMTDLWYYAEGEKTRGPLSLSELLPLLSRIPDLRRVMIWRHGFDEWKAVEDVREVAQQLFRPPPLRRLPPPVSSVAGASAARVVEPEKAAGFKNVKPELTGIGGWLGLLASAKSSDYCALLFH